MHLCIFSSHIEWGMVYVAHRKCKSEGVWSQSLGHKRNYQFPLGFCYSFWRKPTAMFWVSWERHTWRGTEASLNSQQQLTTPVSEPPWKQTLQPQLNHQILQPHKRPWARTAQPSHTWIPDPQQPVGWWWCLFFKPLGFGVFFYAVIENCIIYHTKNQSKNI